MAIKIGKIKLVWFDNCYGWIMTGIIGPDAKWFLGYSTTATIQTGQTKPSVHYDDSTGWKIGKVMPPVHFDELGGWKDKPEKQIQIVSELPTIPVPHTLYAVKAATSEVVDFYYTEDDTVLHHVTNEDERLGFICMLLHGNKTTGDEDDGKWWL